MAGINFSIQILIQRWALNRKIMFKHDFNNLKCSEVFIWFI